MSTAFLFPGQGSQHVGMGKDLFDAHPAARARFEEADEILGFGLSKLMFGSGDSEAAEAALKRTDITQPALLVHSLAALAILSERAMKPDMVAGHSLGEYSALTAAGALSFTDGVRIARERGRLMAGVGDRRPGSMAAVIGLDAEVIEAACADASSNGRGVAQPANYNAPDQIVISGDEAAVDAAMKLITERGARRVLRLPVGGAFHSPLMEDARAGLATALDALEIRTPRCPVYLNVTGGPATDPDEIRRRLLQQLTAPVRWAQTLQQMHTDGAGRFVEVGTGKVLTGLVRKTLGRIVETAQAGKAEDFQQNAGG